MKCNKLYRNQSDSTQISRKNTIPPVSTNWLQTVLFDTEVQNPLTFSFASFVVFLIFH